MSVPGDHIIKIEEIEKLKATTPSGLRLQRMCDVLPLIIAGVYLTETK